MPPINRRTALGLLGSTALVGCAAPEVVSRNGNDPFEGGIGGTGIVGLMTGYGSILINGLTVELTSKTRVVSAYGTQDLASVKPGMALSVVARRTRDGFFARDIAIDYALVGPARLDRHGKLTVNGIRVLPERGATGRYSPGGRVAVSGIWSTRGLVASRFDPAPHGRDLIAGSVGHTGKTSLSISGAPIQTNVTKPMDGTFAVAYGSYRNGQFTAEEIRTGRFATSLAIRQLSVEGYLEPVQSAPGFRVSGLGHSFADDLQLNPFARLRTIYFGPYTGLFNASVGYVVPEGYAARRKLLGRGIEAGFDGPIVPIQR